MNRYADPRRCPDCRAEIAFGATSCASCGLSLTGTTAQQLFVTLTRADELLSALRAASSAPAPIGAPASAPAAGLPFPTAAPRVAERPHAGLSAASVPKILLTLSAGCLLVAALVFLAVTWSVMSVGGRTATLVGFTAVAGGLAAWMARRGLRAAAESLSLVGYGLLTLDVVGADNAGWFGDLSTAGLLVLVGAPLALTGVAGALAARRTTAGALTGAEVVAAIGTALVAFAMSLGEWFPTSPSLVIATLVAVAAAAATHSLGLRVAAAGTGLVGALAWLTLTMNSLERAFDQESWGDLWLGLEVWPLLVAAAIAASLAGLRRLQVAARVAALAVAHLLVVAAALAPVGDFSATTVTLTALGVLAVAGALTWLLPRPWGLVNALTQAVAGLGVLSVAGTLVAVSSVRLVELTDPVWAGRVGARLLPVDLGELPAGWLLPLCVLALVGTCWALAEASPVVDRVVSRVADLSVGAALLAASVVGAIALYPVPVWLVLGVLMLVVVAFTGWWFVGRSLTTLALAAVFLAAGLLVSLHDERLTAGAVAVALAAAALVHLRARGSELAAVGGALLAATLAGSAWTWGAIADVDRPWVALAGLVALGALALVAPYAPSRWWTSDQPVFARTGLEAGAAAAALPLGLAGVMLAPEQLDATWAAVYLTVAGLAVTAMSLLRADRRRLGWVGGGLLALGSWVRLYDIGVESPEPYTVPSAVALLCVGVLHLRRHPEASTMTALAPGLSLALVPSLLWALDDPTGPRALLLGLACLGLVLGGVRLGWTAPIVLGATVGGVLVLRMAAPYIGDAVPRWVLIGGAGALLIVVGATWERRVQEARHLMTYVRALR